MRNELLTATVKLFFKRPPEVQRMLGRLFKAFLADGVTASVRDRALMYYRLLRTSVADAGAVIGGERPSVAEFHDEQAPEVGSVNMRTFPGIQHTLVAVRFAVVWTRSTLLYCLRHMRSLRFAPPRITRVPYASAFVFSTSIACAGTRRHLD